MQIWNKSKGFTLIELVIVTLVIAILAAIAYPAYQDSVLKSKRADAKELLLRTAQAQERHFTQFAQYATNPGGAVGPANLGLTAANLVSDGGFYNLLLANPGGVITYTLTANDTLNGDAFCGSLTLTQTGLRGSSVPGNALACW